jgi:hypothetical protein
LYAIDADGVEPAREVCGELVQRILPDMADAGMQTGWPKEGDLKGAQATVPLKGNACTRKKLAWPTSG